MDCSKFLSPSRMFFISATVALTTLSAFATTVPNLQNDKDKLVKYYQSGQYNKDILVISQEAMDYAKKRITINQQSSHPKKLAAVFDIDETLLSNYPDLKRMQFGGTQAAQNKAINLAHDPAIQATKKLYNYLIKNHVSVFLVTGRKSAQRQATLKNLKKAGFKNWSALYLKPNNYNYKSAVPFKSKTRHHIENQGYDIIFSMGDQWSDLDGGYSDRSFKLPNPYYKIQ